MCNKLTLSERNMCLCMCPLLNDSVHRPSSIKCMQTKNFEKLTSTKLEYGNGFSRKYERNHQHQRKNCVCVR